MTGRMFLLVGVFVTLVGGQEFVNIPTATEDYKLDYFVEGGEVTLRVSGRGKGFVGFGFTNVSGMVAGDIFIGGVGESGEVYYGDYSSVSTGTPRRDAQEDWELLEAVEDETYTTVVIRRVLDTGDAADIAIKDELMSIIWAIGPSDALTYHGFSRSSLKFNLISGTNGGEEPEPPPTPPTTAPPPTTTSVGPGPTTGSPGPGFTEIPIPSELYSAQYSILGDTLTVAVSAGLGGYVGFGFTNDTGMTNSDLFIGGVRTNGSAYFGDYTGFTTGMPSLDTQGDWSLLEAEATDGGTYLKFSRLLVTGDWADIAVEDKPMSIVWSLGPRDEVSPESWHGPTNRGQVDFNLVANA